MDSSRGSQAPFFTVYEDHERTDKYGYYCGNCETLVTSMDSMGRMECTACGNQRKPTRWDSAYL
jgi:rRNA maturation endonuclease Nob1